MLRSSRKRAARSAAVAPSPPNMRSNRTRGFSSMGIGRGGGAPGDRVHVGAGVVAAATAEFGGVILGGDFERREGGFLADLLRDELIDGGAAADLGAVRRHGAVQPHGVAQGVAVGREDRGAGDDIDAAAERLEGFMIRLYWKPGLSPIGVHWGICAPMRDIDKAGAQTGLGGRLGQRGTGRNHRVEQRQRKRDTHAAQERTAVHMLFGQEHGSASFFIYTRFTGRAHRGWRRPAPGGRRRRPRAWFHCRADGSSSSGTARS